MRAVVRFLLPAAASLSLGACFGGKPPPTLLTLTPSHIVPQCSVCIHCFPAIINSSRALSTNKVSLPLKTIHANRITRLHENET